MYTECPNCHTTFRVSTAQLKLAEGKVRCGRCDHVFNAVAHLLEDVPGQAANAAPMMSADALSEMALDNTMPQAEDLEQTLSEVAIPGVEEDVVDEPGLEESVAAEDLEMAEEAIDDDLFSAPAIEDVEGEMVGEELLDEEPEPAEGLGELDLDGDLSDLDLADELGAEVEEDLDIAEDELALDEMEDAAEEDLVEEEDLALDDDAFEEAEEEMVASELEADDDFNPAQNAEDLALDEIGEEAKDDVSVDDLLAENSTPFGDSDSALATDFGDSELGFQTRGEDAADDYVLRELGENETRSWTWLSTLAWTAVILILLVVLVGQFLYFKRDELVRYPAAKAAIEQMCGLVGAYLPCDVPEPKDLDAIQLLERDVRSHPNTKGALLISATILSGASFVQPYPNLVLTFSDMNQKTIARRVFKPEEYLKDKSEIANGMQPETPIRVILEIVDPGQEAVNFEFEFE